MIVGLVVTLCAILLSHQLIQGKVKLSQEVINALSSRLSKSSQSLRNADYRVMVAFTSDLDNQALLEKGIKIAALQKNGAQEKNFLASQALFNAMGDLMVSAVAQENSELESMLLSIVDEKQIVRRLPIGNTFVLTRLTVPQAAAIANLNRTALLTLSLFKKIRDEEPRLKLKSKRSHPRKNKRNKTPFDDEPISEIRAFNPLQKVAQNVQWNVQKTGALDVWQQGIKGSGIVYGVIDSGVSFRHPVLKGSYVGFDASTQSFNHNWSWWDGVRSAPRRFELHGDEDDEGYDGDDEFDPSAEPEEGVQLDKSAEHENFNITSIHNNNVLDKCNIPSDEPCDSIGHGTHVLSTAIGGFGFGVAPEAKWIACRSIANGWGRDEDSLACLNFMLAPHARDGTQPRPWLRPHVIGNSYGWPSWREVEGAGIHLAVKRLEAAGTVMVFAAGNSGPQCGTIHSAFSFTVGATDSASQLAMFSSRGPWYERRGVPGRQYLIKPELVAPGHEIHGAYGSGHAAKMSGTSMAAPLVAGSIALLLQACSQLLGRPEEVLKLLQSHARPLKIPFGVAPCGRDTPDAHPNNHFGHGEIDIKSAIASCKQ